MNKGFDYFAYAVGLAKTRAAEDKEFARRSSAVIEGQGAEATANSPAPEKFRAKNSIEFDDCVVCNVLTEHCVHGKCAECEGCGICWPVHDGTTILALEDSAERAMSRARIDFEMRLQQRTSECQPEPDGRWR